MNDDIRRQLEAAGHRLVPEPRPEFAAALQERLLAAARTPPPGAQPPPATRRPGIGLAFGFGVVAIVLGLVAVLGGGLGRPSPALELTGSVHVEVALADGTTLVDPEGLLLPDGAVVRVGDNGSARIGDVELRAGDVATVDDQRVSVVREPRSAAPLPDGTPTTARASATPTPPATAPPTTPSGPPPTDLPTPTDRPSTRPPDVTPAATAPTRPTDPPAATVTPDIGPTPKPTLSTDARPLKLEARAAGPREVGAMWTGTPGARRYVLVASSARVGSAPDPVYPGSAIIGTFTRPPLEPLVFRVPEGVVEVRLLVVALGADGAELSRSNIATVAWWG